MLKTGPEDVQNLFVLFPMLKKIVLNYLTNHGAETGRIPVSERGLEI